MAVVEELDDDGGDCYTPPPPRALPPMIEEASEPKAREQSVVRTFHISE